LGKRPIGTNAIVVGGQEMGLATAEYLSEQGCRCTILEDSSALGADLGGVKQMVVLPRVAADPAITVRLNTNLERIGDGWVEVQSQGKRARMEGLDLVVFAWRRDMVRDLADEIAADGTVPEVHLIGDAQWPREMIDVIYEGAVTGRRL
jgi:NADPH-dependent 2,4-dienoyl-CoA reductase/sulfur reductase-like enzyme